MNYAQAQYSTESGKALILSHFLTGKHDDADIRVAACYMCRSLKIGTMQECKTLVKAAIESKKTD